MITVFFVPSFFLMKPKVTLFLFVTPESVTVKTGEVFVWLVFTFCAPFACNNGDALPVWDTGERYGQLEDEHYDSLDKLFRGLVDDSSMD